MKAYFKILAGSAWEILTADITWEIVKLTALLSFTVACFFFTIVLGWMLWYPYEPIRIDALHIDKTEARVGELLCFTMVGEKLMPIPVRVAVELVDGEGVGIVNYWSNVPMGLKFKERCFNIPMHIKTNHYQVKWTGTYSVNGLRNITKEVLSKPIYITNHLMTDLKGRQGRRGEKGVQGTQGRQGDRGKSGGVSLFGKGEKGDTGAAGKPCKECNPAK
jgi:hypothetical protein